MTIKQLQEMLFILPKAWRDREVDLEISYPSPDDDGDRYAISSIDGIEISCSSDCVTLKGRESRQ